MQVYFLEFYRVLKPFHRNFFILPLCIDFMSVGITLLVVGILVVAVWIFIEIKRFKHKLFAIFLIVLILLAYVSLAYTFKGQVINFKTVGGWETAAKVYFSFLGTVFGNLKTMTSHAVKMDWRANSSEELK